ncbi:MAG: L-threonylcarbamoyladenylate synthase [Candidatus Magasanikbacteria bacterium]
MAKIFQESNSEIKDLIKEGSVGVIPTDTIYGIVGSALEKETVQEIYKIKKRDKSKPFIILIDSLEVLRQFDIKLTSRLKNFLKSFWPGPVSVIFPCDKEELYYLHRGKKSLAFRVPREKWLRNFLRDVGPLVAPSANISGEEPAETIGQAQNYFGEELDFYLDRDRQVGESSILIELKRF